MRVLLKSVLPSTVTLAVDAVSVVPNTEALVIAPDATVDVPAPTLPVAKPV